MNTNFNIVKKPKKEDVEIEEDEEEIELDDGDDKPSKSSSNDLRKRMFLVMGFIVGGTILLLFILYLCSLLMHKTYDYADIENLMESSAKKYFKDNPNYLPTEEGNIVELDVNNLVAGSYMKNLSEYTGEGVTCSGTIQVEKSGSEYLYTPYLNCGDQYYTEELYKKIVNDNNVVTSGYGLYSHNGSYAYRGEEVNNYVKLDNSLWRIVKVTSNNNVVLIHNDGLPYTQPWDDRYNESRFYAAGINSPGASRIKEYLNKVYKNSKTKKEDEKDENILSNSDKAKLVSYNLCTAKRAANSTTSDNTEECQENNANQKLGLLTLSDYIYASIDPNCKTAISKSCQNYNYLSIDNDWWLATANSADNSTVYKVDGTGVVSSENASNYCIVRPVVYLNSKILYKGGEGTLEKPYTVK